MTRDHLRDLEIDTPEEFESVLADVVETAVKADIDVRRHWTFSTEGSTHDWEVEIIELAREHDEDR